MEKNQNQLAIYCLGGPWLSTEWTSLMGSKYQNHMDFVPVLVNSPELAQVIVWDGVLTPKSSGTITGLLENLGKEKILLLTGEAETSFSAHPFVKLNRSDLPAVVLSPSRVLPEEILEALQECRKRLGHV